MLFFTISTIFIVMCIFTYIKVSNMNKCSGRSFPDLPSAQAPWVAVIEGVARSYALQVLCCLGSFLLMKLFAPDIFTFALRRLIVSWFLCSFVEKSAQYNDVYTHSWFLRLYCYAPVINIHLLALTELLKLQCATTG